MFISNTYKPKNIHSIKYRNMYSNDNDNNRPYSLRRYRDNLNPDSELHMETLPSNNSKLCNNEAKPLVKFRDLDEDIEADNNSKKNKLQFILKKKNKTENTVSNKKKVKDSWEYENYTNSFINYIIIGDHIVNLKDQNNFQKKVLYNSSIELNRQYDEYKNKKLEDNYSWIRKNPEKYRISKDISYMLHSNLFSLDFWDDIVNAYKSGKYEYDEFLNLLKYDDLNIEKMKKELKTIQKKLKQIENIEKKKNKSKDEMIKLEKKNIFIIRKKMFQKELEHLS